VPIELVKDVGILDVAPNTLGHRSLPRTLQQVPVGVVVEAINRLGGERTSLGRSLLIDRQLGILGTDSLDHYQRSIIVGESILIPILIQHLVHAPDEVSQRHIFLQLFDNGGVAHVAKQYGRVFIKIKTFLKN